jgi:hypothetical protein
MHGKTTIKKACGKIYGGIHNCDFLNSINLNLGDNLQQNFMVFVSFFQEYEDIKSSSPS